MLAKVLVLGKKWGSSKIRKLIFYRHLIHSQPTSLGCLILVNSFWYWLYSLGCKVCNEKFYSLEIWKIAFNEFSILQALNYLGIQPTKEQHQALRQQVQADSKGTVSFGGNIRFTVLYYHRIITQELLWHIFIKSVSSLEGEKEK